MGRVQLLPEAVINHIAAGEVIERPASVVKELMENALDAQARTIKVAIQGGGVDLIQVDDDGIGMDAEDAVQCFTRHATSKIRACADLDRLTTMGFRGEALPSIATVSRLHMVSRCAGEAVGTRVLVEGGAFAGVEACGAPPGTSMCVRDLFYNTPARLKFLKHVSTEASHIAQSFTALALTAPSVHMTLHLNGRLHMQTPPVTALGDRLEALFGAGFQHHLLVVDETFDEVQVSGLIGNATLHRATRRQQFFFVNGRPIQNRAVQRALYEAYRTLLPRERHPMAFLFLTLPSSEVDVNVHPAKLEVRFRQEARLYDRLRRVLQRCLQASAGAGVMVSPLTSDAPEYPAPAEPCRAVPMMWRTPAVAPEAGVVLPERRLGAEPPAAPAQELNLYAGYPDAGRAILTGRPLGQLHDTYLVMQYPEGVFIVDQHAAHERVLYERLRDRLRQQGLQDSQSVLFPETLELGATEAAWVATCLPRLTSLGFTLEPFGRTTYRVLSVPAVLTARDHTAALMDILEVLRAPVAEESLEEGLPQVFHRLLTVMACHGALRAHQRLQDEEIRGLLQDLARTAMPFTCPHGRPVLLHIGLHEIEKKFRRC